MKVDIKELKDRFLKKTRADIIDLNEMQIIIPVLLREIETLAKKLENAEEGLARFLAKRPALERKGKSGKAEWLVRYEISQNCLYLKLEGVFDAKNAKTVSNTIVSIISHAQKGFDVISDVKSLRAISDLRVLFHLKKVRFNLKQSGVRRIVRVIDKENKVIAKLFGNNEKELTNDVYVVDSLEEAKKLLESPVDSLKL